MRTLSDCVFDWMRREFAPRLGVCAGEIRRETPLARFLPSERRRAFWSEGQRELGLRFPTLELPPQLQRTGFWVAGGSALRMLVFGLAIGIKAFAFPLALVSAVASAALYGWLMRSWATERPDLETFGDLSKLLLARNLKTFRQRFGLKPNRDEIFTVLVALLAEHLGVDPREITPETSFAELID